VLDYLQREMVRQNYRDVVQRTAPATHNGTEAVVLHNDLQLEACIEQLPTQCRSVFRLSRQEDLSMKEIAARLDISEKTVENHLGNALKKLRLSLREFLGGIALAVAWLF
jgi:RNA polymerase sigma-70 factor (ECF subfamily)